MGTVANLVVKISANTTEWEKGIASLEKSWKRTGAQAQSVGSALTKGITLPLAAIGGISLKAASDFESSFAGVRKTVNATEAQFKSLASGLRSMAKEIPVNVNELNHIAELGGQLGIQTDNILKFTRVIADMGVSTSLSTEEAAMGMAQFASITQMSQNDFDRLGSTIVGLGNDMATTEPKILDFGLRLAGAGHIAGLTEAQILAISAAMASVGVDAEAGGTAVQKVLLAMNNAAQSGKGLGALGAASGMGGAAFGDLFKSNPGEAFTRFIEGIGSAGKQGANVLQSLGFDDQRQVKAFLSLATAGDKMRFALDLANKSWTENVALSKEAEQRYATFASQVTILKNHFQDLAITVGLQLIESLKRMKPAIETIVTAIALAVEWFSNLPQPVQTAAFSIAALAAATGPLVYLWGTLMSAGSGVMAVLRLMPGVSTAAGAAMTMLGSGTGALSLVMTGLGYAVAVVATAWASWKVGGWLGEVTGLTDGVGKLAAKTGEFLHILPKGSAAAYGGMRAAASSSPSAATDNPLDMFTNPAKMQAAVAAMQDAAKASSVDVAAVQKAAAAEQAQAQAMERIKSLHDDLSGAKDVAAAKDMAAAMRGINVAGLSEEKQKRLNDTMRAGIDVLGDKAPAAWEAYEAATRPSIELMADAGTQMKNLASMSGGLTDAMKDLGAPPLLSEPLDLSNLESLDDAIARDMEFAKGMQEAASKIHEAAVRQGRDISDLGASFVNFGQTIGGITGGLVGSFGAIVQAYGQFQQTGGPQGAIQKVTALTQAASAVWSSTTAGGGGGMNALKGAAAGAQAGMAFGPYGAAVGAGVGALIGFAKSRIVGKDEKDARKEALAFQNDLLSKFMETASAAQKAEAGGERWRAVNIAVRDAYVAIGKSEQDAMRDLARFNDATHQNAEAVQSAAAAIQSAFDEQAADADRLTAAIQNYGFSFAELGKQFQQNDLNKQSKELIEDWRVLVASGISMSVVNDHMASAMNQYLQTALAVGAEVPAAMAPILKTFADQGLLTDAAGNKITDLAAAGVVFSETMSAGFDRVVQKLDILIQSLIAAGTAIDPLASNVIAMASAVNTIQGTQAHAPTDEATPTDLTAVARPFAAGGIVRRPTFALIGEAGPEAVVPLSGGSAGKGMGGLTVNFLGPVFDGSEARRQIAAWYHDAIEHSGDARNQARRLGLVPA